MNDDRTNLTHECSPEYGAGGVSERRTVTLCSAQASALGLTVTMRLATSGRAVKWISGNNHFNPYTIAREASTREASPDGALGRIQIARAFTAYQLTELIGRLQPEAEPNLVIISGLCTSFLDEDVTSTDAARLFYRVLWRTVELTDSGSCNARLPKLLLPRPLSRVASRVISRWTTELSTADAIARWTKESGKI